VDSIAMILLIGVASIVVRVLIEYDFDNSALLYVGVPYLIALTIVLFRPVRQHDKWWHRHRDHFLTALVVFLASSIVVFEGFVCVVFFMPIYFFVVSIAFTISGISESRKHDKDSKLLSILPVLVLVTSLEGTSDQFTIDRNSSATVTKVANLSSVEVLDNIAQPFDLNKDRHWLLSIFPMPYEIEAGSLNPGDIHHVRTRYHRWFVANTHEGELQLQIVEVDPNRVKTKFIHDSTFFASYVTLVGTEITLTELSPGKTEVSLRIDYQRKLDPAWYFQPLQKFGIEKMAEFLIDEVMIRGET
jgi:hypothetical protein